MLARRRLGPVHFFQREKRGHEKTTWAQEECVKIIGEFERRTSSGAQNLGWDAEGSPEF